MMRTVAALLIAATAAVTIAGCTDDDSDTPASVTSWSAAHPTTAVPAPPTTAAVSSSTPVAAGPADADPAAVRAQSCRDMLPMLSQLHELDPATASRTAEDTVNNLPSTPEWATMSPAVRDATAAGIRDAADGQCS